MPLYRVTVKVEVTTYAHNEQHAKETAERAIRSDPQLAVKEAFEVLDVQEGRQWINTP